MDKQTYISLAPLCRSAAEAQAARYVQDEAEREDIVQDVLLKMWEQHELLQPDPQKLKAYAATLARNHCLNRQKHRRRHPFLRFFWGEEHEETPMPEPAERETPHSRLESEEMQRVFRTALARLPENQRKIFLMRSEHDLPFCEIASILGTSESSVRGTLCKARARLLELIKKEIR